MASSVRRRSVAEDVGHRLGVDPVELDLRPVMEPGMAQRLDHRHVGVGHVHVLADDADADAAGRATRPAGPTPPSGGGRWGAPSRRCPGSGRRRRRVPARAGRGGSRRCSVRRPRRRPLRSGTSHSSEILRFRPSEIGLSLRQTMTSGWIPRLRSSVTECWVGLVFCSPESPGRAPGSGARSRRCRGRRPAGTGGWPRRRGRSRCHRPCRRSRR